MLFDEVWALGDWTPIRDCPGRYVLRNRSAQPALEQLVGSLPKIHRFPDSAARDCVLVVSLQDGGLISYERADGSYLHTLNTTDGLRRKLDQLGIAL